MAQHQITGEIIYLQTPTATVVEAARALGTRPEQIAKSVLFTIGEARLLAITTGTRLIERRALAARYGVGRKRVKLASPEIVLETTGYPVGTVPPFGHLHPVETLLDPGVLEYAEIYAGGGAHNAMLRLAPQDILRVVTAEVFDLHTRPAQ